MAEIQQMLDLLEAHSKVLVTRAVLHPGADEETLGDGDRIDDTQGALVLEKLIGDFVTRMGS